MGKKIYRKFNFWEPPTDNTIVEKVDPVFFKSIKKEIDNNERTYIETKTEVQKEELLFSKVESCSEILSTDIYEQQCINKITENIETTSAKKVTQKILTELEQNYKELIQDIFDSNGGQWKVLLYCAEKCLETGTLSTGYIKLPHVAKKLNLNEKTVYTAIYRLEKQKRLIIRQKGKEGAGGKSRFMFMSDKIKNYILSHRDNGVNETAYAGVEHNLQEIPGLGEWKQIDISPLKEIGLNEKHLLQLKKHNTPQIIQESIHQFSFGLKYNEQTKKYSNPLLVFIGVLRKGEAWVEKNYMSPNEIALQQLMEQKKNKMDKLKKAEEEYFLTEYNLWEQSLTKEDKDKLLPDDVKRTKIAAAKTSVLRTYFRENIWPTKIPIELIKFKEELKINTYNAENLQHRIQTNL
jgi:hypothetical protein